MNYYNYLLHTIFHQVMINIMGDGTITNPSGGVIKLSRAWNDNKPILYFDQTQVIFYLKTLVPTPGISIFTFY